MRLPALLLLLATTVSAQEIPLTAQRYLMQEEEAFRHYRAKEWDKAVAAFERQIAIFKDNPRPYYNIACCYGLQGDAARAATWLNLAIAHGWRDADHLGTDPDFDGVRETPEYIRAVANLARARSSDPDPLPRRLPLLSAAPARSSAEALSDTRGRPERLAAARVLLDPREYRKRLFAIYDRRMARLARYLAENGDAKDAASAAHQRVRTALLYLKEADDGETDRDLRRLGALYTIETTEQFLRGFAGDPDLADILYARAHARRLLGRTDGAERDLMTILRDHPQSRLDPVARIELCGIYTDAHRVEDLRRAYGALLERWGDDPRVRATIRGELMEARLLVDKVPNLFDLDVRVAEQAEAHEGAFLYVCVAVGDEASQARLAQLASPSAALLPVIVCIDRAESVAEPEVVLWLKKHARGLPAIVRGNDAVERLGLTKVPTVILATRDSTLLAIDPTPEELARLVGGA